MSDSQAEVESGNLVCTGCGERYPLRGGIADFFPLRNPTSPEDLLKQSEMHRRDREAPIYESLFIPQRHQAEMEATLEAIDARPSDLVLELGVGTARIARQYAGKVRGLLGVDLSWESLRIARDRLREEKADFLLLRADIDRLPLRSDSFAKVVSTQVFEHLPGADARCRGLAEVERVLEPGGHFMLSVYHYSLLKRLRERVHPAEATAKEGRHSAGEVYYYNFGRRELRRLLAERFEVESMRGIVLQLGPWLHRATDAALWTERTLRRTPLAGAFAHLLLACARKPATPGRETALPLPRTSQ